MPPSRFRRILYKLRFNFFNWKEAIVRYFKTYKALSDVSLSCVLVNFLIIDGLKTGLRLEAQGF